MTRPTDAPELPPAPPKGCLARLQKSILLLTTLAALLVGSALGAGSLIGERHWLTGLIIFAPTWIFALPFLILALVCILFHKRMLIVQCALLLLVIFGHERWQTGPAETASEPGALTVVTHNIGQSNRQQILDFIKAKQPDVFLLQDSKNRAPDFAKSFPDYEVASRGEFILASRHLIQKAELVETVRSGARPVAARFEINFQGRPVALYSVHLPTPRGQFNRFLSRRVFNGLFADDEQPTTFSTYQSWLDHRVETARQLAAQFTLEKLPFIVAGDFNTPDRGYIYRVFSAHLTDAHVAAGRGWGYTFPGTTRNPVALFGPWLRIDYIFAGAGWRPLTCLRDENHLSQHIPLSAQLLFAP